MERAQRERFEQAVERKREAAERRGRGDGARGEPAAAPPGRGGGGAEAAGRDRPPVEADPRTKSSGHGQKTADKWNQ